MLLTKKSIIVWNGDEATITKYITSFIQKKLDKMISENKTDGIQYSNATDVNERKWVDEEAAKEWINYMRTLDVMSQSLKVEILDN